MVLKIGHFWKVVCDVGEGWRKISRNDRVKNEEVLQRIKEEGNILTQYKE